MENVISQEECAFFDAFKEEMSQYPITIDQFAEFARGNSGAVGDETYTALSDALNIWRRAQEHFTKAGATA